MLTLDYYCLVSESKSSCVKIDSFLMLVISVKSTNMPNILHLLLSRRDMQPTSFNAQFPLL